MSLLSPDTLVICASDITLVLDVILFSISLIFNPANFAACDLKICASKSRLKLSDMLKPVISPFVLKGVQLYMPLAYVSIHESYEEKGILK